MVWISIAWDAAFTSSILIQTSIIFHECNIDTNQGDKVPFHCSILDLQYSLKKSRIESKLVEIHVGEKSWVLPKVCLRNTFQTIANSCHSISFHLICIFFYFYGRSISELNSYITFTWITSKLLERKKENKILTKKTLAYRNFIKKFWLINSMQEFSPSELEKSVYFLNNSLNTHAFHDGIFASNCTILELN